MNQPPAATSARHASRQARRNALLDREAVPDHRHGREAVEPAQRQRNQGRPAADDPPLGRDDQLGSAYSSSRHDRRNCDPLRPSTLIKPTPNADPLSRARGRHHLQRKQAMLAVLRSAAVFGVDAYPVDIEVDVSFGLPHFTMVGLPDATVRESRDRVRSAIRNSGFDFPHHRITVNLAPADVRKAGFVVRSADRARAARDLRTR